MNQLSSMIIMFYILIVYSGIAHAAVMQGTGEATILTNMVYSSGGGVMGYSNTVMTNVFLNAGGEFTRSDIDKTNGLPLIASYFTNAIKNWGNTTDIFLLRVSATNTNLSGGSYFAGWQCWFEDLTGNRITNLMTGTGATNRFVFVIVPSGSSQPDSWVEYKISAKSSNSALLGVNTTIYTGENNYVYGGHTDTGLGTGSLGPGFITISSQGTLQDNEFIRLRITALSFAVLKIAKSVSNISLGGTKNDAIPGASITYRIYYSNIGSIDAQNVLIIDRVPSYMTYRTQYFGTAVGWTVQWSTNVMPGQSWDSAEYADIMPQRSSIKWVRWKKAAVPADDDGKTIFFEVTIN